MPKRDEVAYAIGERGIEHIFGVVPQIQSDDWQSGFSQWLGEIYQSNSENMLEIIEPTLDKVMIDFALKKTGGKKQEAAKVLGLGRNTLTKKIKAQQT